MSTIFKIIIIIAVLFGLILAGTFISNKYSGNNPKPSINPPDTQLPISALEKDEKEAKALAENFVSGYGSYQKGTFNSLKEAQKMMTKKYQEETTRFIEEKEKEQSLVSAPKEYISYTSVPTKTTLVSLDSKNANVLIDFEYSTFYGVSLYLNEILTTVDQNGEKTTQPLKREMVKKQATVLMIKENGLWKVDSIKIK